MCWQPENFHSLTIREGMTVHNRSRIQQGNRKIGYALFGFAIMVFCVLMVLRWQVSAQTVYTNQETGYVVIIEDDAQLLSDSEELAVKEVMQQITKYGSAALKTISENDIPAESFVENYYYDQFGSNSGTVFLIDMDNRKICLYNNGEIEQTVRKSDSETITDNVYTYASDADYYKCCDKAFEQVLALLQGQKIRRPMKYASNLFLAIILALMVNYFVVRACSATGKPSDKELLTGVFSQQKFDNVESTFTHSTKTYSPQSSGSSGGSSGGGGGSSGGSGGSHSF